MLGGEASGRVELVRVVNLGWPSGLHVGKGCTGRKLASQSAVYLKKATARQTWPSLETLETAFSKQFSGGNSGSEGIVNETDRLFLSH